MTTITTSNTIFRKGMSKRTFRFITAALILILLGAFAASYFFGNNILTPLRNSKLYIGKPDAPSFLYSIYGEGSEGQMKKPLGVTAANGFIYVSDTGNQRVMVFDSKTRLVTSFGKKGTGQGEFIFPYGIAVDSSNYVYVADMKAGSIQVFNRQGEFLKYFAEATPEDPTLELPAGLYIKDQRLYVSDLKSASIKVFDLASGQKLLEFGKSGQAEGEFLAPNAVTVSDDSIIVTDSQNDSIQLFTLNGEFKSKLDGSIEGKNPRTLTARGVGVDGRGVIYTVSMMGNYVTGFSDKGEYLWSFGQQGADDEEFYLPNGLFVDDQGRIYVTDQGNNKVSVWAN